MLTARVTPIPNPIGPRVASAAAASVVPVPVDPASVATPAARAGADAEVRTAVAAEHSAASPAAHAAFSATTGTDFSPATRPLRSQTMLTAAPMAAAPALALT